LKEVVKTRNLKLKRLAAERRDLNSLLINSSRSDSRKYANRRPMILKKQKDRWKEKLKLNLSEKRKRNRIRQRVKLRWNNT
jgi:hypothetical protein